MSGQPSLRPSALRATATNRFSMRWTGSVARAGQLFGAGPSIRRSVAAVSFADLNRPPLSERALRRGLVVPGGLWRSVSVVQSTGSTNADLSVRARAGEAEGSVLVAEEQTTGRGRLNRTWHAPPRSGLAVSVLLRPAEVPTARWAWLPLLVGLVACEALVHVSDLAHPGQSPLPVEVKWPNDLVVDDRKLGGVLVERVDTPIGPAAVVGLGLNVSLTSAELPVSQATSVHREGAPGVDRAPLLRAYLRELADAYQLWRQGRSPREDYLPRCVTLGRKVRVVLPGDRADVVGTAVDVDEGGRLVVELSSVGRSTSDGAEARWVALSSGEVEHVR
jgi:BirA family biotin operon repressor/biotin-[acetyl-CoA-carboxylase] ligase